MLRKPASRANLRSSSPISTPPPLPFNSPSLPDSPLPSSYFSSIPRLNDQVRVESLELVGILRYLGEIDGKPGTWAGVELTGEFKGRGKNDGSVAG
jgi:CAP-Gly domain-containing linker protein 1